MSHNRTFWITVLWVLAVLWLCSGLQDWKKGASLWWVHICIALLFAAAAIVWTKKKSKEK